ncbi:MAG: FAD-dependent oxidoreductase [Egibacteraceae bacterium]
MSQVLVLGGGFGGLAAAHELRRLLPPSDEVVVVSSSAQFFVGFAKLWDLVGARALTEGTAPLEHLDRHGIRFVRAAVTGIDPTTRRVETDAGPMRGDGLVVALGAGFAPAHVALLAQGGHNLYDADALPAMRAALDQLTVGRLVVSILGGPYLCPPAPFEAVLAIDEWLRARGRRDAVDLAVSTPQPLTLPVAGPDASRYVADQLADRDVTVLTEHTVEAIEPQAVRFRGGASRDMAVCFGVPAAAPPPVLAASPLAGASGWAEPDPATFCSAFPRVYAVGDCTLVPTATAQLPKAGVFAEAGGTVAARNLAADLHGGEPAAFDGHGYCYLELPGNLVATVAGDFYAQPRPVVTLSPPDAAAYAAKQQWEADRLRTWLG